MRTKLGVFLVLLFALTMTVSCSKKSDISRTELYRYEGEVVGVVKFNGKKQTEINEKYLLSLKDFYPSGVPFEKYNEMYSSDQNHHDFRVISLTENTRIYKKTGDQKIAIDVSELEQSKDKKVEFWIFPFGYVLEAMEIDLLEN
jgi:uncharacterized LabA/DUF88 family protein